MWILLGIFAFYVFISLINAGIINLKGKCSKKLKSKKQDK